MIFSAGWVAMRHIVYLTFSFLSRKKAQLSKERNIALLHLRRKKKNTSFIWTHTGIVSIVWILLSRNEMHRCHAYCCLLRSRRLVSSHNAIYSQLERDSVAWRDQITVAKADYIYCRSSNREKITIICLQLVAKKIQFHVILLQKANCNSVLYPIEPKQRHIAISNEWRKG